MTYRKQFYAMLLIGAGLVSVGIMFFAYLNLSRASSSDFTAVPAEVDYAAPDLFLTDISGNPVSIESLRGRVALINLWATWCPPCQEEMPTLLAFYERYKSQGFVLIAIDQGESHDVIEPFLEEFHLTFPIWMDEKSQAGVEFKTIGLPSSFVVDRDGQVRLMWIGGISKKNLENYVPPVIAE